MGSKTINWWTHWKSEHAVFNCNDRNNFMCSGSFPLPTHNRGHRRAGFSLFPLSLRSQVSILFAILLLHFFTYCKFVESFLANCTLSHLPAERFNWPVFTWMHSKFWLHFGTTYRESWILVHQIGTGGDSMFFFFFLNIRYRSATVNREKRSSLNQIYLTQKST